MTSDETAADNWGGKFEKNWLGAATISLEQLRATADLKRPAQTYSL
jgi:hypothetical protein